VKLLKFLLLIIIFLIGLVLYACVIGYTVVMTSQFENITIHLLRNVGAGNETINQTLHLITPGFKIIFYALALVFLTFIIAFIVLTLEAMAVDK